MDTNFETKVIEYICYAPRPQHLRGDWNFK